MRKKNRDESDVSERADMKYETASGNRSLKFFLRSEYVYFSLDICVRVKTVCCKQVQHIHLTKLLIKCRQN